MDCSPPGACVHGILQARILEWLPFPCPGVLPDPGINARSPALQADSLAPSYQGSGTFFTRALTPFVRALPSGPNHPRVPSPYTITLDLRFSADEFGRGHKHTDRSKPYLQLFSQPMDALVRLGWRVHFSGISVDGGFFLFFFFLKIHHCCVYLID